MRLIDADLLIEKMRKWYWDKDKQKAAEDDVSPMDLFTHLAITTVQDQPTTYNVNKVIDLLMNKFRIVLDDEDLEWNRAIDKAIEIVKGGGVK